jgi:hypothetical protein
MKCTAAFITIAALSIGAASAQTADFAKLACDDLNKMSLEEIVVVGSWLSGFYNGKLNNTMVDPSRLHNNTTKVMLHCRDNPHDTVMHAIELNATLK